ERPVAPALPALLGVGPGPAVTHQCDHGCALAQVVLDCPVPGTQMAGVVEGGETGPAPLEHQPGYRGVGGDGMDPPAPARQVSLQDRLEEPSVGDHDRPLPVAESVENLLHRSPCPARSEEHTSELQSREN